MVNKLHDYLQGVHRLLFSLRLSYPVYFFFRPSIESIK